MIRKTIIFDNQTTIFDTKRKAEAKASAHQTTNTYYIMKDTKRKRSVLHVAAIENLLATLWIACESLGIVESIGQIDHGAWRAEPASIGLAR